jgi:hypothetical protein
VRGGADRLLTLNDYVHIFARPEKTQSVSDITEDYDDLRGGISVISQALPVARAVRFFGTSSSIETRRATRLMWPSASINMGFACRRKPDLSFSYHKDYKQCERPVKLANGESSSLLKAVLHCQPECA